MCGSATQPTALALALAISASLESLETLEDGKSLIDITSY